MAKSTMVAAENRKAPLRPNQFCSGWIKSGEANCPIKIKVVSLPISLPRMDPGTTDIIQRLELGINQPVPTPSNIITGITCA